jgi:hypothetical protein
VCILPLGDVEKWLVERVLCIFAQNRVICAILTRYARVATRGMFLWPRVTPSRGHVCPPHVYTCDTLTWARVIPSRGHV